MTGGWDVERSSPSGAAATGLGGSGRKTQRTDPRSEPSTTSAGTAPSSFFLAFRVFQDGTVFGALTPRVERRIRSGCSLRSRSSVRVRKACCFASQQVRLRQRSPFLGVLGERSRSSKRIGWTEER